MGAGYGISGIGNYAGDPAFWNVYNQYNPNFMGAKQTQEAQYAQAAQQAAAAQQGTTTTANTVTDPTFKGGEIGSARSSGIGTGTIVGGALAVAGGAAALICASKKGNGKGVVQGFKNIWNELKGKAVSNTSEKEKVTESISKLLTEGKGKLQTCQIKNGTDVVEFAGDKVKQIVTKTEQKIKNVAGIRVPSGISHTSKDVTLNSIERAVSHGGKNYKVILDKEGNVIETLVKNKKGEFVKAGDVKDLEKITEKAQTYTADLTNVKLTLPDRHGVPTDVTRTYNVSVRNGNVVDATYTVGGTTKHLTEEQCKLLQEARTADIEKFGRVKKGYGVKPEECLYEYADANRRYLFKGDSRKTVTEAYDIKSKTINKPKEVSQYLEEHGLKDITTNGKLPNGAKITNAIYKSDSGNIYTIKDGKIVSVKIKEGCRISGKKGKTHTFRAGETINASGGKLDIWQNGLAINNSDYEAIRALI